MSVVRIAAAAAIFTLLSAAAATAKPIATTGDTNLRKAPGTDSPVLTLIPKGTTVEVDTCSNGWCKASFDGQDGFVIAQNVGMAPRRPPRGQEVAEEEIDEVGPPVVYRPAPYYYGYGPYPYGYYGGWGWGYRGWGWGRRW
jgi:uncharacterized protein YraI